jgi:hypothetical protein
MKLGYKELLKDVSESVKIYEITYRDGDPLYQVEVNGINGVILHLNYVEAYEETGE